MKDLTELANLDTAEAGDREQALSILSIQSALRYLQREAETAGLSMTAHLISTAALAVLEESLTERRLMN